MNKSLEKNNYIVIPNFIEKDRAEKLSQEYNKYCEESGSEGDTQVPTSKSTYSYLSFVELLCEKTPEISSILEETVLPTYVYSRVYHNGSVLEKHKDRDACEISLTLNLSGDTPWPIYIETPSGDEREVILKPGDAMMYLGKIAEHWREKFEGNEYTQVFLHYVRSKGDCAYAYFDKTKDYECTDLKFPISDNQKSQVELIIPKSNNTLGQYIEVFENILPENFCDRILKEYSNSEDWINATISDNNNPLNENVRRCKQINISSNYIIEKNHEERKKIDKLLYEYVTTAVKKYSNKHQHFKIDIDTGYNLLKYDEEDFYIEHTDSYTKEQRSISCSLHLSDDYEGGEFAFFDRDLTYKCKKGSALLFPSNFMYPHEIMPVTKGTRYSIITWLV